MNISFRKLITFALPHFRHKIITRPVLYSFTKTDSNMSTLDIVCNKITDLSDVEVQTKQLEEVSMMIEATEKNEKESTIKLLVSTLMKNKKINFLETIQSQVMTNLISDKPFIQFQLLLYQIAKEKAQSNPNHTKINDLYLQIYEKVLNSAEDLEKIKIQVFFYKNFSRHLVENNHRQKGLEAMRVCLEKHQLLITEEFQKVDEFVKQRQKDEKQKKKKDKAIREREQLRTNSMKENVRRLIQSMFQVLYYYYALKRADIKQSQQLQMVDVLAIFGECLKLSTLIPGIKTYSRYFHRLTQINYELEYVFALMKKNKEKIKSVTILMKEFYRQSFNDLEEAEEYVEIQKQIALALMSVRLHLSRSQRKTRQTIKDDLVSCSQEIIERGKFQNKPTKAQMMKLFGEFIKKNC